MTNQIAVKEAPHSKESEMMVLGCALANTEYLKKVAEGLDKSDFYLTEHKTIFEALKTFNQYNKPADIHLICEELKKQDKLKHAGGTSNVITIVQYAGASAYVEEYIDELKEFTKKRQLLDLSQKIIKKIDNSTEKENTSSIILDIQEDIKRIEKNSGSKDKFPIKFISQFDKNFLFIEPSKKPMLLEYANEKTIPTGFLPKGIVAMIAGAGGVGKTHLLAQLAISVSTGTSFLGTFTPTEHSGERKKGNVFFGLGENQYDDIHRILYKASKRLREHEPDILKEDTLTEASKRIAPFSFCGQQASFLEDKKPSSYFRHLKMRLTELAPKEGWALIILDPVSRLMGADAETDNAAATQFIALLEELTIELPGNPTVLFAHHVSKSAINESKSNQTAARGSSALTDGVRWQANLFKNEKEELTLKVTKSNFTAILEPITIRKNYDGYLERSRNTIKQAEDKITKPKEAQEHWATR